MPTTDQFLHGLKTALACLAGFAILHLVHFQVDQWLVIAIIVVMAGQLNVGSMFQKSYMRFLGTLAGSIFAIGVLITLGNNPIVIMGAITLAAFGFSMLATSTKSYSDAGTLGAVTVAIVLIGQSPTVATALQRFVEISLGIFIATLFSQFFFPLHARNFLRKNQAKTIRQIKDYYQVTLQNPRKSYDAENHIILDESIVKNLIAQRKLSTDARRELFGAPFSIHFFNHALWCEREMLRCISFMYQSLTTSRTCQDCLANLPSIKEFHQAILHILEKIAHAMESQKPPAIELPNLIPLQHSFTEVKPTLSQHEQIYLDTFLFCAETLVKRLDKLSNLLETTDHHYKK